MSTDAPNATEQSLLSDVTHLITEVVPEEPIVSALQRQLSWTHLNASTYIENPLKRDFYLAIAGSCQPPRRTDFADSVCNKAGRILISSQPISSHAVKTKWL